MILLALHLLLAPLGCAHDKAALRTEEREKADLSDRTEKFWRSVRWQDVPGAALYIEDEEQRRSWQVVMEAESEAVRYVDVSLLGLTLGPLAEDPAAERLQEATVRVQTEGYAYPAQVVEKRVVVQTWYRSRDGWFLDWKGGDPLTGE